MLLTRDYHADEIVFAEYDEISLNSHSNHKYNKFNERFKSKATEKQVLKPIVPLFQLLDTSKV